MMESLYNGRVWLNICFSKENLLDNRRTSMVPADSSFILTKSMIKSPPITTLALSKLLKLVKSCVRVAYMFSRFKFYGTLYICG